MYTTGLKFLFWILDTYNAIVTLVLADFTCHCQNMFDRKIHNKIITT